MTAVNCVCQPQHNCLDIVTDAASYTPAGVLVGVGTKVFTEPNWPGAIAGRGTAIAVPLLGAALSLSFATFDAMIEKIEEVLPGMVSYYGIEGHAELIIAGFSVARGGPEAYVIETSDAQPVGIDAAAAHQAKANGFLPDQFKLQRLPNIVVGPPPANDIIIKANFTGFTIEDDPAFVVAGLAKMIEMQRQSKFRDGVCWIGGHAQIITINADGVHQRILQRWPEDQIGEPMTPAPVDWSTWPAKASNVVRLNQRVSL